MDKKAENPDIYCILYQHNLSSSFWFHVTKQKDDRTEADIKLPSVTCSAVNMVQVFMASMQHASLRTTVNNEWFKNKLQLTVRLSRSSCIISVLSLYDSSFNVSSSDIASSNAYNTHTSNGCTWLLQ